MMRNIPVRDLEEGMEVCCHAERDQWQIVEDVTTGPVEDMETGEVRDLTTVLLIDGRHITLPSDRIVTVAT